jgi:hypothetical protein
MVEGKKSVVENGCFAHLPSLIHSLVSCHVALLASVSFSVHQQLIPRRVAPHILRIVTKFLGRWGRGTGSRYVVRYLREIFTLRVKNEPVNPGQGR